jgi:hypothetical protein
MAEPRGPAPAAMSDDMRALLRHTLATAAYRGGKMVANAPDGFAEFRIGPESRTPSEILAHVADVLDWGLSLAAGQQAWRDSPPLPWDQAVARFHASLRALDAYFAAGAPLACPAERLFQGPIADTLTHIGQIAMLRRLAGSPVRAENYVKADMTL